MNTIEAPLNSSRLLFDDATILPNALKNLILLVCTSAAVDTYRNTIAGASLHRLHFEKRWQANIEDGTKGNFENIARQQWRHHALQVLKGQSDGLVWVRDDVVIQDFFLYERLSEAWTRCQSIVMRDQRGQPILWALSRLGVQRWLNPQQHSADKYQLPPQLEGKFPLTDILQAESEKIISLPWTLSLILAGDWREEEVIEEVTESVSTTMPAIENTEAEVIKNLSAEAGDIVDNTSPPPPLPTSTKQVVRKKRVQSLIPIQPPPASAIQHPPLIVVCASRCKQEDFLTTTLTGQSIRKIRQMGIEIKVAASCENSAPLAHTFNKMIVASNYEAIALFTHDDVWLDDSWLGVHLHEALLRYDVVGVVGNRNMHETQPSWAFPKQKGQWDVATNLLGAVAHQEKNHAYDQLRGRVSNYGMRRGHARLLDGVFIAARVKTLLQSGVRFDDRFDFNFYDLDFCRAAERQGLRIGVWPIAITHLSGGNFSSNDWFAGYGRYIGKW